MNGYQRFVGGALVSLGLRLARVAVFVRDVLLWS
jgi:hypothetical protein